MSKKIINRAKMTVTGAAGTGDVTLNTAVSGYQTFTNAGLADGDTFPYVIEDGANWETGLGTYHSSGPSFSRTTVRNSSGGGTSKITATSSAIVYSSIMGEDLSVGATTLAALTDATITSPADNDVLTYVAADSKWKNKPASGGSGGTPPTMVQFGSVSANSTLPGITLGSAPISGNLLVAILMTDGSDPTTASGWTLQATFSSGTWFFHIYTKVAGGSESTAQFPVTGGSSSNWACGIWEVHGQNGSTPIVTSSATGGASNTFIQTPILPILTSSICFFALVSTTVANAISHPFGAQTIDINLSSGAGGKPVFGHSDSTASVYGMCATQGSASTFDAGIILVTA